MMEDGIKSIGAGPEVEKVASVFVTLVFRPGARLPPTPASSLGASTSSRDAGAEVEEARQ